MTQDLVKELQTRVDLSFLEFLRLTRGYTLPEIKKAVDELIASREDLSSSTETASDAESMPKDRSIPVTQTVLTPTGLLSTEQTSFFSEFAEPSWDFTGESLLKDFEDVSDSTELERHETSVE